MNIGTKLNIEFIEKKMRLSSKLVGIEEDKYIIIKIPSMLTGLDILNKGNGIIVKYLEKGTAFVFTSYILQLISSPEMLLFVEYPKKIEDHNIRDKQRLDCYLPAHIIPDGGSGKYDIEGAVTDISKGGCKFIALKESLRDNDIQLEIDSEVLISFNLPGLEQPLTATMLAKNKYFSKSVDSLNIGFRFTKMDEKVKTKLVYFLSSVVI